jgi:hypothetical protein
MVSERASVQALYVIVAFKGTYSVTFSAASFAFMLRLHPIAGIAFVASKC